MRWLRSALAGIVLACSTSIASAGTVALFGDVNIYTSGFSDAGNRQVLSNLLDGGSNVLVSSSPGYSSTGSNVNGYYDGLTGVSSSLTSADLTAGALSGVDLLFLDVGFATSPGYTATEVGLIADFILAGGDVGIQVEPSQAGDLSAVNTFLTDIGLSMQLTLPRVNGNVHTADTILATALTAGVSSFTFGANNGITGGIAAIQDNGSTLVAYQTFRDTAPPGEVPLPAAGWLLLGGLAALTRLKRRDRAA